MKYLALAAILVVGLADAPMPPQPAPDVPKIEPPGPFMSVIVACDEHPGVEHCNFLHKTYDTDLECKQGTLEHANAIENNQDDPRHVVHKYCVPKKVWDASKKEPDYL